MANPQEIETALRLFHDNRPQEFFETIRRSSSGVFPVLHYLAAHQHTQASTAIKSKEISDALHISSARMAILLQKLEQKELIYKSKSTIDARVTLVHLSQEGSTLVEKMHQSMRASVTNLVDQFGLEHLENLFKTMGTIKAVMYENMQTVMEEYYD